MTISTVGIPDRIRQLGREGLQFNLALSLHVVDQKIREELIPLAKQYTLDKVIDAVVDYFDWTGREVTLEYLLLKDINCNLRMPAAGENCPKSSSQRQFDRLQNPTSGKYQPPSRGGDSFLNSSKILGPR